MRYDPRTDRAVDLNEIAKQCMDAVLASQRAVHEQQIKRLNACFDLPSHER